MTDRETPVHSQVEDRRDDGEVPSISTLRRAAASLRAITERTSGLPEDSPADAQLRDRLDLAVQVLDAAAGRGARGAR